VAAVFFGANPNVLYLQCTGMTEILLMATIAASVYHLMRWAGSRQYTQLVAAGCAGLLGTLTRYEAWVYCAAATVVVGYVAWRRPPAPVGSATGERPASQPGSTSLRARYSSMEAHVICFCVLALSGIAFWVIWNAVIFGDPLYFQTGPFAKPSLWYVGTDPNIGHFMIALKTYYYAVVDNAGTPALALGGVGLLVYLTRTRLRPESSPVLTLTIFAPFFVYALYSGQRPLYVNQVEGTLYNVRFGVLMVLAIAVFAGYLSREVMAIPWRSLRAAGLAGAILAGFGCATLVARGGIDTYSEAVFFRAMPVHRAETAAGLWLRAHYTGGTVLMEEFGNELTTYSSRLPLGKVIYEGSFRQWQRALADPFGDGIRWIFMRSIPGGQDDVYAALSGTAKLRGYQLVYSNSGSRIYQLTDLPKGLPVRHGESQ
jgi:hypothetical protein